MQINGLKISLAQYHDKSVLRNLMQLYLYDFSEFDQAEVDHFGLYGYKYLDHYWTDPNRYPFLFWVEDQLAGFALISRYPDPVYGQERWAVAEFFILKKFRRQRIGTRVAARIFDMFPGKWQVSVMQDNLPARTFWREVIAAHVVGAYEEVAVEDDGFRGIILFFDNTPAG